MTADLVATEMEVFRRPSHWPFYVLAGGGLLWSCLVSLTGGLSLEAYGIPFSSRDPVRPLVLSAVSGCIAVFLHYGPLYRLSSAALARASACGIAVTVGTVLWLAIDRGSFVAGGADSSAYLSQALLWQEGLRDVPAAFWWTLALTLGLSRRLAAVVAASAATAMAIASRPNLAPIGPLLAALLFIIQRGRAAAVPVHRFAWWYGILLSVVVMGSYLPSVAGASGEVLRRQGDEVLRRPGRLGGRALSRSISGEKSVGPVELAACDRHRRGFRL